VHSVKDDRIKGWYCNITRPAHIDDNAVSAVDLALDVWIGVDGSVLVLDEDEFARLNLAETDRHAALKALEELKELARLRRAPFDGSEGVNR
jgi:protein associated with RNAse G/E